MSVKVTTPTKTNFGTGNICPNGEKTISTKGMTSLSSKLDDIVNFSVNRNKTPDNKLASSGKNSHQFKKNRRSSEKGYSPYNQQNKKKGFKYEKQKEKIKLPTKFLLGGNITDPLNLNSLNDEEISKEFNAITPVSSPLPTPAYRHQKVEVLIPPNINDPLNLNSGDDACLISPRSSCKKRKKNKRKKSGGDIIIGAGQDDLAAHNKDLDFCSPLTLQIDTKARTFADTIVSPAIPQDSPRPKKRRSASDAKTGDAKDGDSPVKSNEKHKFKKQASNNPLPKQPHFRPQDSKFVHGNYNRYYGKRNPGTVEDHRLKHFLKEWFDGKDVFDIGCNIGHITLSVAKQFNPKTIIGMDIDPKLISIARKNIRHYLSADIPNIDKFPVSLAKTYGPVAAPNVSERLESSSRFPDNVNFVQGNYVLDNDELLELQTEEFDAILCLSVTKWMHLNFGDDGLKRVFKRMFRQLHPGGKLILEPQPKRSYKKKRKLNETIWKNFNEIKFWPDRFRTYLLSPEIGFSKCEYLDIPYNKSEGFQRPIMVFTKLETKMTTPREVTESRGVTPLMNIDCGGHGFTPRTDQSYTTTPVYDLHPSFSFSSAHMPIRGYDAFLENQVNRAFTPTQELIAATGRIATPRFDIGTPSVSARNTPSRPTQCSEGDGPWFNSQESNGEQLFEQLSDENEDKDLMDVVNESGTIVKGDDVLSEADDTNIQEVVLDGSECQNSPTQDSLKNEKILENVTMEIESPKHSNISTFSQEVVGKNEESIDSLEIPAESLPDNSDTSQSASSQEDLNQDQSSTMLQVSTLETISSESSKLAATNVNVQDNESAANVDESLNSVPVTAASLEGENSQTSDGIDVGKQ